MKINSIILILSFIFLALVQPNKAYADTVACTLVVPNNILDTWVLNNPCHENNSSQAVFVQGVVFDKDLKTLSVYSPLVIDEGTTPAVQPTLPVLPLHYDIGVFGGGDDDVTTLVDTNSQCINGADGLPFGQVFYCGTSQLFADVKNANIQVPPIGVGSDGLPCPTIRDFRIVDQDMSDNVQTTYLINANGQTAQNTSINRMLLGTFTLAKNPSDNRVLTNFIDPALGCNPWLLPDIADNNNLVPTQFADEFQASLYQQHPIALIPAGDPFVGPNNVDMLNAYRVSVFQPQVKELAQANTQAYCGKMNDIATPWLTNNQILFSKQPSPVPALGTNLYTFMEGRLAASFILLGCNFAKHSGNMLPLDR